MRYLIVLLVMSISSPLFAQIKMSFEKWNKSIELKYKNNTKIHIVSNSTFTIQRADKVNLDSIVKVALKTYKNIEEETDLVNSKTVTYENDLFHNKPLVNDSKESICVVVHEPKERKYGFMKNGETVEIKTLKDTLIIKLIYGETSYTTYPNQITKRKQKDSLIQDIQLVFGFIVNDIFEIENLDYQEIKKDLSNAINEINTFSSVGSGSPLFYKKKNTAVSVIKKEDGFLTRLQNPTIDNISINFNVGGGWVRDRFITSTHSGLAFERGLFGIGFEATTFYNIKNLPDNKYKIFFNTFQSLTFRFNELNSSLPSRGYAQYKNIGTLSIGYLTGDESGFFSKNSWRLAATVPIVKALSAELEWFIQKGKQNDYPGIRLKVGL